MLWQLFAFNTRAKAGPICFTGWATAKKPRHIPGKANLKAQKAFLKKYEELKQDKSLDDQIYFIDGVHSLHNSQPAYGWMKKDCDYTIQSNTCQERNNISGAVNIESLLVFCREDESIDSHSANNLFKQIFRAQKQGLAYIIVDNALYSKSVLITIFKNKIPGLFSFIFRHIAQI